MHVYHTRFLPLGILAILFVFFTASPTSAATITNMNIDNVNCGASTARVVIDGSFQSGEAFTIVVTDGSGNEVLGTAVLVLADKTQLTSDFNFSGSTKNPFTVEIYAQTGGDPKANSIGLTMIDLNCFSDTSTNTVSVPEASPGEQELRERGIDLEFDNGEIILTEHPDGHFESWVPNCKVGHIDASQFQDADLARRYIVAQESNCGYQLELWSLGYPACQLQFLMYGPNATHIHELPRQPDHPSCQAVELAMENNTTETIRNYVGDDVEFPWEFYVTMGLGRTFGGIRFDRAVTEESGNWPDCLRSDVTPTTVEEARNCRQAWSRYLDGATYQADHAIEEWYRYATLQGYAGAMTGGELILTGSGILLKAKLLEVMAGIVGTIHLFELGDITYEAMAEIANVWAATLAYEQASAVYEELLTSQ